MTGFLLAPNHTAFLYGAPQPVSVTGLLGGAGERKEEHGPAKAGLHVRLEALLQS